MCVSSACFLNVALSMEVNYFSSAVNRECILYHHVWPVENTLLWCFVSRGFLCCSPRTDLGTVWGFLQEACAVNTALTSLGLLCCTDAAKNPDSQCEGLQVLPWLQLTIFPNQIYPASYPWMFQGLWLFMQLRLFVGIWDTLGIQSVSSVHSVFVVFQASSQGMMCGNPMQRKIISSEKNCPIHQSPYLNYLQCVSVWDIMCAAWWHSENCC